jgi:HSP20 family protein
LIAKRQNFGADSHSGGEMMNIRKIVPWNWFKDEERDQVGHMPVLKSEGGDNPLMEFHQEFDRFFDNFWNRMGIPAMNMPGLATPSSGDMVLRPSLDIASTDKAYDIKVEVPGVEEDDIRLELIDNRLIMEGEKSRESTSEDKNVYRSERSYGAFRRILTLPDDADPERIEAKFDKGLLSISIPRKAAPQRSGKTIDIKTAA